MSNCSDSSGNILNSWCSSLALKVWLFTLYYLECHKWRRNSDGKYYGHCVEQFGPTSRLLNRHGGIYDGGWGLNQPNSQNLIFCGLYTSYLKNLTQLVDTENGGILLDLGSRYWQVEPEFFKQLVYSMLVARENEN